MFFSLLYYLLKTKGYMSNLGLDLRYNQNHTIFLTQEQPCIQFILHLHEKQPINYIILAISHSSYKYKILSFTTLQHDFFLGFTIGETLKKWLPKNGYRSMHIIGYKSHKSRDSFTIDYQVVLPIDYWSTFIRSSVGFHRPTCRPLVG